MRLLTVTSTLLTLLAGVPQMARAQDIVPAAGAVAVGVNAGGFMPRSNELSTSPVLNGTYEYYVTPRVSLGASFGWANPAFDVGSVTSLMQLPLTLDGAYNWERGRWHPFVGGGVGLYFLQFRVSSPSSADNRDTRVGLNTGGGVEYFVSRTVAVTGEGRYHFIPDARGEVTSGMTVTAGLKTFF